MYIEIPEDFANAMNGKTIMPNQFLAVKTIGDKWVTSANAVYEFENDFNELKATGWIEEHIELTSDDFEPPAIHLLTISI